MKKFCALLLAALIPVLSFGSVQYNNDGTFAFDKAGEVYLNVSLNGTTPGHVGNVGYFVSMFGIDDQSLVNNLAGGDKTLGPFQVTPNKNYGLYMTLTGNGSSNLGTYYSASTNGNESTLTEAKWFSYDAESHKATFKLLNGDTGEGMGNNTITFTFNV